MTNRIFEAADINERYHDAPSEDGEPVALCSGTAYLSEAFADPEDNALDFDLCADKGGAWIVWACDLPANVALGSERLEAALLSLLKETYGDDYARR